MAARPQPKIAVLAGARPLPARNPRGPYTAGDIIASKYRLKSLLGEGGMGSVWAAENLALDVDVAVKLLRVEVDSPEAGMRLLREARAAAQLKHPSIVQVYDFGETELEDPFIVMEVLRGGSLSDLLDRKVRLTASHAVRLLLPVASALTAAHDKGIVHRDLKPGNIVLSDGGDIVVPKIVDFGIAKLKNGEIDGCSTQAGAVLGSPDYMSPEQARGRPDIDERTDVWSLAVVLYEAITGRRPFEAANYNALINAIIEDLPPPVTDFAAGDAELWTIIERGLEKAPAERWPTMKDLGRALASWAVARGILTDSAGTPLYSAWLGEAGIADPSVLGPFSVGSDRAPISRLRDSAPPSIRVRELSPPPEGPLSRPPRDRSTPARGGVVESRRLGVADTLPELRRPRSSRIAWLPLLSALIVLLMALGVRYGTAPARSDLAPAPSNGESSTATRPPLSSNAEEDVDAEAPRTPRSLRPAPRRGVDRRDPHEERHASPHPKTVLTADAP